MKPTILVVDDSASLRSVVRMILERAGYRVAEAIDGRDALRKVSDLRPALVLCDVNMPGLDGLGLVRQIKAHPEHRSLPVLMLTTSTDKAQKAEAAVAGAQAWITKPVQPEVLLGALARLLPQPVPVQEKT